MVYRGKPSAGCENCRKAKKRCGLEQPTCLRCVKLKKICSGYRDTTSLQIQDESESVKRKAERQKVKTQPSSYPPGSQSRSETVIKTEFQNGIPTPASTTSDSTSSSDSTSDTVDVELTDVSYDCFDSTQWRRANGVGNLSFSPKPKPEDVATTYFLNMFTDTTHWSFMRMFAWRRSTDRCLDLAIKACGMAALGSVESAVMGKDYARSMYVQALGLLNEALRDPTRSKTDESLLVVSMLKLYENITCEGKQSIQSWKAHVQGATQLLKLRGKAQFQSPIGRILFRETRNSILISCLWDDQMPPSFLWEYQSELQNYTADLQLAQPMDDLTFLCFEFAILRANMRLRKVSDAIALERASELERQFIQWQIDTTENYPRWRYYDMEVEESEHVWDGKVLAYMGHPAPSAWNLWRNMRIMLSRTQEMLSKSFPLPNSERDEQLRYFRSVRRQMTDDICATIPVALGHASPAYSSSCVLITAYASVWPLFFAGSCALERVGPGAWSILMGEPMPLGIKPNAAAAQAMWIMNRLEYISKKVGLKWADGVLATLRGDFAIPEHLLKE